MDDETSSGISHELAAAHRAVYTTLANFLQSYHIWLYITHREAPGINVVHIIEQMQEHRQKWLDAEAEYVDLLQRSVKHGTAHAAWADGWTTE